MSLKSLLFSLIVFVPSLAHAQGSAKPCSPDSAVLCDSTLFNNNGLKSPILVALYSLSNGAIAPLTTTVTTANVGVQPQPILAYCLNGSNWAPCNFSNSGATTPATNNLYKGNGAVNGVVVAVPGTDYLKPNGVGSALTGITPSQVGAAGLGGNTYSGTQVLPNLTINTITGTKCLETVNGVVTGITCPTNGTGTISSGSQYAPVYYTATGTVVGGVTPFDGIGYYSSTGPPSAANSAQIVSALNNSPTTTLNSSLIPTLNQSTTGNAATSTTTTNVAGGVLGSIPYQSGSGSTVLLNGNSNSTDQVLISHGTGANATAPSFSSAPAISAANMTNFPGAATPATSNLLKGNGSANSVVAANGSDVATAIGGQIINPKQIGNYYLYADQFAGADAGAKINACNAALITLGGGTCDDRNVLSGGTSASTEIDFGDTTETSIGIHHIWPVASNLTIGFNDSSKCGIKLYSGVTLEGAATGGGGNRAHVFAGSGSTMDSLLCTSSAQAYNNYMRVGGLALYNASGATMSSGYLINYRDAVDESYVHDVFATNYSGNVWNIRSACCGATFERIQGYGSIGPPFSSGGIPLTVGANQGSGEFVQAITVKDSTFNGSGTGNPDIKLTGSTWNFTCINCYTEGNGANDTTTALTYIDTGVTSAQFIGGMLQPVCASTCASKYAVENHSAGTISFIGVAQGGSSTGGPFLNDVTGGVTYPGTNNFQGNTIYLGPGGTSSSTFNAPLATNFNCSLCAGNLTGLFGSGSSGVATDLFLEVANSYVLDFQPTNIQMRSGISFEAQNSSSAPDLYLFHDPTLSVWDVGLSGKNTNGGIKVATLIPGILYSAAGTALPTCASGINGEIATVSDATSPTYMGTYTSGGSITVPVVCSFNGSAYAWKTH